MNLILIGTLASFLAGSANIIGAAAIFFVHRVSEKFLDAAKGFAVSVMFAATFFGLAEPEANGGFDKYIY